MRPAFAALDLGSNTFRLLIARPRPGQVPPWETLAYAQRIVRLGEGLHHTGRLSEAAMERAMAALREFAALLDHHGLGPDRILALGTAAMREAENGEQFRTHVAAETGIAIEIIDAETEAETSLMGAACVLPETTRRDMLLVDIGGASTEFVRVRAGDLVDAFSRKLGVVRLVNAHLHSDPPAAAEYKAMVNDATVHLNAVEALWGDGYIPKHLVGTAGTVTTLAAIHLNLVPYDAEQVNNHCIPSRDFLRLRDRLLAMTHVERQAMPTIEEGRADLIIAGLAILEAIMHRWGYTSLTTVDAGLLEGAWLKAVMRKKNQRVK